MRTPSITDVRYFWEHNPLFCGESQHEPGSKAFFEEHKNTIIKDNFAGKIPDAIFPEKQEEKILDLGCGPGFWAVEFSLRGHKIVFAADLTWQALQLTKQRCLLYEIQGIRLSQQNAESLGFINAFFSHVNCQGVIHHTPNPEAAIQEIHRVLKANGTATISVYYKNIFLSHWENISWLGYFLYHLGAKMLGRGREKIFLIKDANEIVRYYDGADNPIGKSYTRKQFFDLLQPYFEIIEWHLHLFPTRSLPINIPHWLHRWLDKHFGFMIWVKVKKKTTTSEKENQFQ